MNVSMQEHPKPSDIWCETGIYRSVILPRQYRRVSGNSPLRSPRPPRCRNRLPFCPPTSSGVCAPSTRRPTGAGSLHPQQHSHEVRPVLDGDGSSCRVVHKYGGVLPGLRGTGDGGNAETSASSASDRLPLTCSSSSP